jgi:hypothetical protein
MDSELKASAIRLPDDATWSYQESVVLRHAPVPWLVIHGHVRPQPIPLLRPLLGVLPSVVQPNSTFNQTKQTFSELAQSSLNSGHSDQRVSSSKE